MVTALWCWSHAPVYDLAALVETLMHRRPAVVSLFLPESDAAG